MASSITKPHTRWASVLLHTKLLAVYANDLLNKRHSTCLVLVLTCSAMLDAWVSIFRAIQVLCGNAASDLHMLALGECVLGGTVPHRVTSAGSQHSGGEGLG